MFKVKDRYFADKAEAELYFSDLESHYSYDPDEAFGTPLEIEELMSGRPPGQSQLVWGCRGTWDGKRILSFIRCKVWTTDSMVSERYFVLVGINKQDLALAELIRLF